MVNTISGAPVAYIVTLLNRQTNIANKHKLVKNPNLLEADQVGYLQDLDELNSGPPNTNPSSGEGRGFEPGTSGWQAQRPNH